MGYVEDEVAQYAAPGRRVDHYGMELDAIHGATAVGETGVRRGRRARQRLETGGRREDRVTVIHPALLLGLETAQESLPIRDCYRRRAVLAAVEGHYLAAQFVRHKLKPVADTQDGDAAVPDRRIRLGSAGLVDAGRAARQDQAARL